MSVQLAAVAFGVLVFMAVLFQLLIAAGAPWGRLTMGGRYPGTLPGLMRAAAAVQASTLLGLAALVLSRAGVAFPGASQWSAIGTWVAVAVSSVALVLNVITPSKSERNLWAPVALGMTATSL